MPEQVPDQVPQQVPQQVSQPLPAHVRVAVVGCGFAGIATVVELRRAGLTRPDDLVVLERADSLGGTWRDNTYPGAACDVPSDLYSLSFAPNPDWRRHYATQPEILRYLHEVARDHQVLPHLHTGTELNGADWDEVAQRWQITTSCGPLSAQVLVLATGAQSTPLLPAIPGADTFAGAAFHSAQWDHTRDLTGRRVAVIGTGASAIQFVPHVQQAAAHLTVFQRTPGWVTRRVDPPRSRRRRRLQRAVPWVQRARRSLLYLKHESYVVAFRHRPSLMSRVADSHRDLLRESVDDAGLREALTPTFTPGCKRILYSNDYAAALSAPNARLVIAPITEITPTGVVTRDGDGTTRTHEVDTIIWGTGFDVHDPPIAHHVRGTDGRTLAQVWAQTGRQALHGTTVAGFPNLAVMVGPNTGLGHTSLLQMIETQARFLRRVVRQMAAEGIGAFEPRPQAQQAWTDQVQRDLAPTVWASGCDSWYLDDHGRNTTLWPTFTFTFRRRVRRLTSTAYDLRPAAARSPTAGEPDGVTLRSRDTRTVITNHSSHRS